MLILYEPNLTAEAIVDWLEAVGPAFPVLLVYEDGQAQRMTLLRVTMLHRNTLLARRRYLERCLNGNDTRL